MKYLFLRACTYTCIAVFLASCGASRQNEAETFTAAEWNLQALFDGEETGTEYSEYREASRWGRAQYSGRLTVITQAILKMTESGASSKSAPPDLLGLIEVENAEVLEDLASRLQNGCFWTAFASLPLSPLGIGFISRYPILEARAHSITINEKTAPRPVLEVRLEPGGKPLVFLLCHWKSKLGGGEATESLRRASARVVQRRLRELAESEAETPVIVMGDLNENHDEFLRQPYFCALLPDDPKAAAMARNARDFLVLSGEKPPRAACFPEGTPALYSPWYNKAGEGSYFFMEEWETIDHILLSQSLFDGTGWELGDYQILKKPPFIANDGAPDRYIPRSGRGLSDHLPLLLVLCLL